MTVRLHWICIAQRIGSAPTLRQARRGGVSLLEVIFSIGIVAVGLLGVLTIIPVAGMRAQQGVLADAADRLGKSAIHQFKIREMGQQSEWRRFNATSDNYATQSFPTTENAICIDPLFVSYHAAMTPANDRKEADNYFPYGTPNPPNAPTRRYPSMRRVGLYNSARTTAYNNATTEAARMTIGGHILDRLSEIFISQDDLVFNLPEDITLPADQGYIDSAKRSYQPNLSWMAQMIRIGDATDNQYLLYIVVYHRRDLSMEATFSIDDASGTERAVDVYSMPSNGQAGGIVVLRTNHTYPESELKVKKGDWLMLANAEINSSADVYRWYRVVSTSPIVADTSVAGYYQRYVTLQGPDWDYLATQTSAILVNNVVAVYEKTVRQDF